MVSTLVCLLVVGCIAGSLARSTLKSSWYQGGTFYQIDLGYFKDSSSSDCIGDIQGVIDKIDYLKELKVAGVVLSQIYSDGSFIEVNPKYGKIGDFENLVKQLNDSGIGLILEIDLSSTYKNNSWFTNSNDYYIKTGKADRSWVGTDGQPAWKEYKNTFYLSLFGDEKVHLNLTNPNLTNEISIILQFWLDKGVNGFKFSRASYLVPDISKEELPTKVCPINNKYKCYIHDGVTTNTEETYGLISSWSKLLNKTSNGGPSIAMVDPYLSESAVTVTSSLVKNGAHLILWTVVDDSSLQGSYDKFTSITNSPNVENIAWKTWDVRPVLNDPSMLDNVNMMTSLLPGTYLLLAGDEIGMKRLDRGFQWDNSQYSGFTNCTEKRSDLVNSDYITVNLKLEEHSDMSHLSVVKRMESLRQDLVKATNVTFHQINEVAYVYSRELKSDVYIFLLNQDDLDSSYDLSNISSSKQLHVHTPSVMSTYKMGDTVQTNDVKMTPFSAVVLTNAQVSSGSIAGLSLTLLLICFAWLHL